MSAWNYWYHITTNTYGTWLPGDPRGWRSRDHKRHVDGDYRNPPPTGADAGLYDYAKRNMKQSPVFLTTDQRKVAGQAMVEMLVDQRLKVIALSLDAVHCHFLARFPSRSGGPIVGRAKKHAYFKLHATGHVGKLWARACRMLPITDRQHQVNTYNYIRDHAHVGAWVWTFKEGLYWRPGTSR